MTCTGRHLTMARCARFCSREGRRAARRLLLPDPHARPAAGQRTASLVAIVACILRTGDVKQCMQTMGS